MSPADPTGSAPGACCAGRQQVHALKDRLEAGREPGSPGCLPATAVPESRNAPNLPNPNDVSPTTSHDLRCPRCSAHTSPGADWCTLCFADLRPKALREDTGSLPAVEAVAETRLTGDRRRSRRRVGNGKHARAATTYDDAALTAVSRPPCPRDPAETAEIEARADEMLAMLTADSGNPLGPHGRPPGPRHTPASLPASSGSVGVIPARLVGHDRARPFRLSARSTR